MCLNFLYRPCGFPGLVSRLQDGQLLHDALHRREKAEFRHLPPPTQVLTNLSQTVEELSGIPKTGKEQQQQTPTNPLRLNVNQSHHTWDYLCLETRSLVAQADVLL